MAGLLKSLLRIDIVPAQRHVDDDEGSPRSAKLSKLLHDHFRRLPEGSWTPACAGVTGGGGWWFCGFG
jgi:hypothetical protein